MMDKEWVATARVSCADSKASQKHQPQQPKTSSTTSLIMPPIKPYCQTHSFSKHSNRPQCHQLHGFFRCIRSRTYPCYLNKGSWRRISQSKPQSPTTTLRYSHPKLSPARKVGDNCTYSFPPQPTIVIIFLRLKFKIVGILDKSRRYGCLSLQEIK